MDRPDGLAAFLFQLGWDCTDIDIVNSGKHGDTDDHDLQSDHRWDQIHSDVDAGYYQAVGLGTPCETASRARTGSPGPRPLRSAQHIYGLPKSELSKSEWDQVQAGTYFALKSAGLAKHLCARRIPWFLENPDPSGNPVSLFNLPEWTDLAQTPGVSAIDFHQCPMGSETAKPTRILYFMLDLGGLAGRCNHPPRTWCYTSHTNKRRTKVASHPPLAGRLREDGKMATKAAAAYPAEMNRRLAAAIAALPTRLDASPRDIAAFHKGWES